LEMITEAMVGIAIMEQPMQFEMRLRGFLDHPGNETAAPEENANSPTLAGQNELSAAG